MIDFGGSMDLGRGRGDCGQAIRLDTDEGVGDQSDFARMRAVLRLILHFRIQNIMI